MIIYGNPWEGMKTLLIGFVFGYLFSKWRHRRPKTYEFGNFKFGDLGDKKRIQL